MIVNIRKEYQKALTKKFDFRLGEDDPTITYQEFVYFDMLRTALSPNDNETFDPQATYEYKNKILNFANDWNKLAASKHNKIEILKPWDEVF